MTLQESLGDRYTVIDLIGEGGAGSVYKARDKVLDVFVAIKVMKQDDGGMGAARLQREAMAAGKLKHKNIAKIFDFGLTSNEMTYMVMEYLPGDNLQGYITKKGKLTALEAMPIFVQICDGLAYAHKNGIVHRDLKPSNIVLMKDGKDKKNPPVAKILDFGIARIEADQRLTTAGAIVGSPAYMSPEQIELSDVTAQSDIYSFGCLMHEALSGHPPFEGESVLDTLQMHKNAEPRRLSGEDIPSELADLILECLQKQPEDRPENVQVLKWQLEKIIETSQIKDRPIVPEAALDQTVVFDTRNQGTLARFSNKTALAVSGVILLLTVLLLSYFGGRYLQTAPVTSQLKDETKREGSFLERDKPLYDGDEKFSSIRLSSNTVRGVGNSMTDDDLKSIKSKDLKTVRIEGQGLTGSGLKYLKGFPIEHFELCGNELKDENLKYLCDLPNLSSLCLESDSLSDDAMKEAAKCKRVGYLLLICKNMTNKSISYSEPLKALSTLKIQAGEFDDKLVDELFKFKMLDELEVINCKNISKNFGVKLAKIPWLRQLTLDGKCSAESLRAMRSLPLVRLGLRGSKLDREGLEALVSLSKIKFLSLSSLKCKESNCSVLTKLPSLDLLDLSGSAPLPDALYDSVAKTKISGMDFSSSKITPVQLMKLVKMGTLRKIDCSHCPNLNSEILVKFKELHKIYCRKDIEIIDRFSSNRN